LNGRRFLLRQLFGKLGLRPRSLRGRLQAFRGRGGATIEAKLGRSTRRTDCGISLSA